MNIMGIETNPSWRAAEQTKQETAHTNMMDFTFSKKLEHVAVNILYSLQKNVCIF